MRRILYLEPVGGIAGDMFLAAGIDLGLKPEAIEAALRGLSVPGWKLAVSRAVRHAISGTHLDVVLDTREAHPHRAYADIRRLIESASTLSPRVKERALAVFRAIGEAEAKVHGVSIDDIHFHEVGAVDSIVDICGAAVVLELLGDPEVHAAPPPLGSGSIRVAHGTMPIPVPATLELLRDVPVRFEGVGELTTPTGAALLKVLAHIGHPPDFIVEKVGYGVGTKDFKDRPNVLRASLGRMEATRSEGLWVVEANLDDATPQLLGHLVERLLAVDALDAWVTPVVMKKSRPGHLLSALVEGGLRDTVVDTLLRESTTLGVRYHRVERQALERDWVEVETPWGKVRVKRGLRDGAVLNAHPEFEDCRRLAEAAGVPLKQVVAAALVALSQRS
ncbi:nickel pincer cofactor biosynthesis protein LarC [Myxococcus sp. CA056]|uniref:nickel pincer cofactor biosynthesis protein LarC n=1 Tax=unclassified Myxococcus TaxID=2648731 RepID=UPI00157B3C1C|nr:MULTISPECIES: nickel pincer cofactor biosynthesis protein LarC [unclassified Myxococcus]NTX11463.1 nickel pincer cofactor biosynthesis protein LarC [Myxococcus sp. CA056]NTX34439.1 nickel pincer cofactor biosynthesis protein LarC [Myxococcus sp. CA033]NTX51580.1 nickel pincer cofactor biosynthesis protein LarC [Myxococcus sp. CA039A]